jgi:hypothetical protein
LTIEELQVLLLGSTAESALTNDTKMQGNLAEVTFNNNKMTESDYHACA